MDDYTRLYNIASALADHDPWHMDINGIDRCLFCNSTKWSLNEHLDRCTWVKFQKILSEIQPPQNKE